MGIAFERHLFAIVNLVKPASLLKIIRENVTWEIIMLILGIMIFKKIIEVSGAVTVIPQTLSAWGISPVLVICLVPFTVGALTGVTTAFIGISYPILSELFKAEWSKLRVCYVSLCGRFYRGDALASAFMFGFDQRLFQSLFFQNLQIDNSTFDCFDGRGSDFGAVRVSLGENWVKKDSRSQGGRRFRLKKYRDRKEEDNLTLTFSYEERGYSKSIEPHCPQHG